MKIVSGALVYENSSQYGNIGESMAETARLHRMIRKICEKETTDLQLISDELNLAQFRTDKGYLRHPDAPFKDDKGDSWREDDTDGDMYLPWYLEATPAQQREMKWRVIRNFMRYGNGDLVQPGFAAEIFNQDWARTKCCQVQLDLFSLKYRWSDADGLAWYNHFQPTETSAADYLNFSMVMCERPESIRAQVRAQTLIEKFESYYGWDANKDWYLDIARKFLRLYFT